ncbi:MAG: tetratricopeptide repeat protein [Dyadobacter sp.]|uniref:tetratricopeptide repeat protein n=1 Tax=Dyadobacter sp. TaxID=1914288 RepID=UPI001B13959B|nr:tetratricopeptide repeat protein [Dyadobacter sp.]MBO9612822.1 tetratricopeptide repeat protein [Dyadobacter sp.]
MEFLVVIAFFGYIYYLRNYADLRTPSEKEAATLSEGIKLYENGQTDEAFAYFDSRIRQKPKSCIAYLYRGLCQKKLRDPDAALADIQAGLSYDDQVFLLHLELGKLYLDQQQPDQALIALNKAVALAEETSTDVYHWRANALTQLGRETDAMRDAAREAELKEILMVNPKSAAASAAPFFDKRLVINMVMILLTSALLVYVIKNAESIHLPYLVAVFAAISIGFVEPHKGWLLAIMQCILLAAGYFLLTSRPDDQGRQELENFSLYGSMILTFAASFLGGFLKRALNMK